MIATLYGSFLECTPTSLLVEVQGVGYYVNITLKTYSAIQTIDEGKLYIHHHFAKDQPQCLWGFSEIIERTIFRQLLDVNGIGPNSARMILSYINPDDLRQAILSDNVRLLQSIKGIGGKTAQRMVLELKDKITKTTTLQSTSNNNIRDETLLALVSLGFARAAVEKALIQVQSKVTEQNSVEEWIRYGLQYLAP